MSIASSVVDHPNIGAGVPGGFGDWGSLRAGLSRVIGHKAERAVTFR
jgi:hypothetical protein